MDVPAFFPNPDYGDKICRRAIRLINRPGETIGELEDAMHAIRSRLVHDGTRVLSLTSEFVRYPLTTCPAATTMMETLSGLPLATPLSWFYGEGRARLHCTHMHDLAWWMIAHAGRDEAERRYECVVPDHPPGREVEVRLLVDGEDRLVWTVRDDIVQGPAPFAGQNLMKRFVGWATGAFEGEMLEAVLLLHKGYFVSLSHQIRPPMGHLQPYERQFDGACWSYSKPRADEAIRLPSYREFPDGAGLLDFREFKER